jgi:uncharacterized protein (TIGR00269 family)
MKCRVCKEKAVINIRRIGLPLCSGHFVERFEKETLRIIKRYKMFTRKDRIAVMVSGGKDSLSLLYVLKKLGFDVTGVHIHLGIYRENYSDNSLEFVRKFEDKFGIRIYSYIIKDKQKKGIEDIIEEKSMKKPCAVCGMVKRYLMNRLAIEKGYNVVATGHNLDDESARLFGNIIYWQEEHIEHQEIVLPQEGDKLLKKVKPFSFFSEKETSLYAILNSIPYIKEECPYSEGAKTILYKGILNTLERRSPGTKYRFLKGFYEFKSKIKLSNIRSFKGNAFCERCGVPTIGSVCGFCKVFEIHPFLMEKTKNE